MIFCLKPLFHQESKNIMIREELYFFQPIRDFPQNSNETGKKQLRIFVEFGLIQSESPRYCDEFTTVYSYLFGSTAIKLEYAECMQEPTEYKQIFVTILDNSWYFFSRYHLCLQGISCKMNASHIKAVVLTQQLECQKQL